MKCRLSEPDLAAYLARQIRNFFPDRTTARTLQKHIARSLPAALDRMSEIFEGTLPIIFYATKGEFDHFNSDQYAMFLYLLSHQIGWKEKEVELGTKIYLLNKALHGIDAYYEIQLPRVFNFAHPVGTVLGRAIYGDRLVVMQNCTIGNIDGIYPRFGSGVVLCSGTTILGNVEIGSDTTVGAGSLIVGKNVPPGSTVVGRGRQMEYFPTKHAPFWTEFFKS